MQGRQFWDKNVAIMDTQGLGGARSKGAFQPCMGQNEVVSEAIHCSEKEMWGVLSPSSLRRGQLKGTKGQKRRNLQLLRSNHSKSLRVPSAQVLHKTLGMWAGCWVALLSHPAWYCAALQWRAESCILSANTAAHRMAKSVWSGGINGLSSQDVI